MNERPILFSGPMVRAILAGNKTQTRRPVRLNMDGMVQIGHRQWHPDDGNAVLGCPYGQPGSRLWVRETWADVNSECGPSLLYRADGDMRCWEDFSTVFDKDYGAGPSFSYETYPGDYVMWWGDLWAGEPDHHWKPSIHMPRWASRLTLEITDIRVQRVREISLDDARAEGIPQMHGEAVALGLCRPVREMYGPNGPDCRDIWDNRTSVENFAHLWDSINLKRAPWSSNPLVWAITFKVL